MYMYMYKYIYIHIYICICSYNVDVHAYVQVHAYVYADVCFFFILQFMFLYILIPIFCLEFIEGNFEVKLPTIWTDEKQRWEESEKRRKKNPKRESPKRQNFQVREKVVCFSNDLCLPEGGKVGSLKAAGAEPAGQMRDEKLHAAVARSTFPSQRC